MATRKDFKTVGDGVLSSFISRNNDVNRNWGIGKLYSHMLASKSFTIMIDLLNQSIHPVSHEFNIMVNQYSDLLFKIMKSRDLTRAHLKSAILTPRSS